MELSVGVKLRLAATESHSGPPRHAARCQLQLLVGLPAHRCDLTRVAPTCAMEIVPAHPHAIAPVTGPGSPAHRGGVLVPGTRRAPSPPHGPRGETTGPAPRTRPPWQVSPCGVDLMPRVPQRGEVEEPLHAESLLCTPTPGRRSDTVPEARRPVEHTRSARSEALERSQAPGPPGSGRARAPPCGYDGRVHRTGRPACGALGHAAAAVGESQRPARSGAEMRHGLHRVLQDARDR